VAEDLAEVGFVPSVLLGESTEHLFEAPRDLLEIPIVGSQLVVDCVEPPVVGGQPGVDCVEPLVVSSQLGVDRVELCVDSIESAGMSAYPEARSCGRVTETTTPMHASLTKIALLLALAVLTLTAPFWLSNPYYLHVLIMAGIFAVLALSLNLLLGYTGQLSLGHAAFFGIGAYASALLTLKLERSVWEGMALAIILSGVAGWGIGRLALKLRGAYFVLVTISFAGVISLVSVNWMELTNGPLGLPGVPAPELGPWSFRTKSAYYYLVLVAVALSYLVCHRLVASRIGRAFVALRENEALAESVGIDVTRYLVLAAVVSAAMAGLAGSLYAHYTRFVSPEVFLFTYTVTMVIMVVAGGKGTLAGPVVGALLFTALPEALREVTSWQWQMLAYGAILVLLVFFLPRGIVPTLMQRSHAASPAGHPRSNPASPTPQQ
jgi:branched-chain amino acid transport system permease protein